MMLALRFRVSAALITVVIVGCGYDNPDPKKKTGGKDNTTPAVTEKGGHNLAGWWCSEHGLPEEECSMCSASFAKQCKDKGDWCDKHNRAKSQCFVCDPSLKEKYAAIFRKKEGKDPPPVQE